MAGAFSSLRPVPKLGKKIVAGLKSDEILPLLLCEEVVEVAEAALCVKAGSDI